MKSISMAREHAEAPKHMHSFWLKGGRGHKPLPLLCQQSQQAGVVPTAASLCVHRLSFGFPPTLLWFFPPREPVQVKDTELAVLETEHEAHAAWPMLVQSSQHTPLPAWSLCLPRGNHSRVAQPHLHLAGCLSWFVALLNNFEIW